MSESVERSVRQTRFAIEDLQKRIAVLEATREDLERQIRKLTEIVPDEEIKLEVERDGYLAYGSYAESVNKRKTNIRASLENITVQHVELAEELKFALDSLDSFERVRARQMAVKAERSMKIASKG